jgi:hypothetical protein
MQGGQIRNRSARVHVTPHGPRVDFRADLVTKKSSVTYRCHCAPRDGHDHEKEMVARLDMLGRHDVVADSYRALEGHAGEVEGVKYRITNCKIRILGPAMFELYLSLEAIHGADQVERVQTWTSEVPDEGLPTPAEALRFALNSLRMHANEVAHAHKLAKLHRERR